MRNRLQQAEQFRHLLRLFAASLEESQALEVPAVFPAYQAGRSYAAGDYLSWGVNGVGDPQLYRVVQAHTSSETRPPDAAPALYRPLGLDEGGHPLWQPPSGAHDAYNKGDVVSCSGVLYASKIDGNICPPDAYAEGWEVYADAEQP